MFAVIFIILRGDYCGQVLCENCVSRNFVGTSRKFWTFEHDGHLIDDAHSAVVSGGTEADINCYSPLLLLLLLLLLTLLLLLLLLYCCCYSLLLLLLLLLQLLLTVSVPLPDGLVLVLSLVVVVHGVRPAGLRLPVVRRLPTM